MSLKCMENPYNNYIEIGRIYILLLIEILKKIYIFLLL